MFRVEYIRKGEHSWRILRTLAGRDWRDQLFATDAEAAAKAAMLRQSARGYTDVRVVDIEAKAAQNKAFRVAMGYEKGE